MRYSLLHPSYSPICCPLLVSALLVFPIQSLITLFCLLSPPLLRSLLSCHISLPFFPFSVSRLLYFYLLFGTIAPFLFHFHLLSCFHLLSNNFGYRTLFYFPHLMSSSLCYCHYSHTFAFLPFLFTSPRNFPPPFSGLLSASFWPLETSTFLISPSLFLSRFSALLKSPYPLPLASFSILPWLYTYHHLPLICFTTLHGLSHLLPCPCASHTLFSSSF